MSSVMEEAVRFLTTLTFMAACVAALLLYYVFREVRMVLHVLNGACLP